MERRMKNKEINVFRRTLFLLVLIIVFGILTACGNPSMIPVTVVPEIHVKALPAYITSVEFTVTGPGMEPLSASYDSLPDSINLAIPPGEDRYFELLVYVDGLLGLTPAISFKGSATVDLTPGDVVVELTMRLDSTKLVVPDYQNKCIIQFDDISGAGELSLVGNDAWGIGWAANFYPYDIDFDNQGRIYIANYNAAPGFGWVIRVDNIFGTNSLLFIDAGTSIVALTVDRNNDYLYYSSGSDLWRVNLDGTGEVSLGMDVMLPPIKGMSVDEEGILYIAEGTALAVYSIHRYDPVSQIVTATYSSGDLNQPWDTLVKGDYVYVANRDGADNWKIIRLNKDLTAPLGYGLDAGAADLGPDYFYGPRRFVAVLNGEITIIDDREMTALLDKLVSIVDITGANWTTLPLIGNGQLLFKFYSDGP